MKSSSTLSMVTVLVCSQIATASAREVSSDDPIWSSAVENGKATLFFMTPGSDEVELAFDCGLGSGSVHFFVGETSPLKPQVSLSGSFAVGRTRSTFTGHTVPNEMSGTSSFEGHIRSDAEIFKVFTGNRDLEIRIGRSFQKLPLKTANDQAVKFAARCRK